MVLWGFPLFSSMLRIDRNHRTSPYGMLASCQRLTNLDGFQVRRQMAAALASVLIASGLPAVAQEPAMVPAAQQQEISAPATAGGIQNWRYSEFISAVEKDKVEKVIHL